MSLEQCSGTLERVTDQGIVLDGQPLSYSKWFEGPRLSALAIGHVVRVVVDAGKKHRFLKRVLAVSGQEQARDVRPGQKPPENSSKGSAGGGFSRVMGRPSGASLSSPAPAAAVARVVLVAPAAPGASESALVASPSTSDLTQKRETALRITRSAAFDRALLLIEKGIPLEKVVDLASAVEAWLLRESPPAAALEARAVGDLFNKALLEGFAADWHEFRELLGRFLGHAVQDPYRLSPEEFSRAKEIFALKLGKESAA